MNTQITQNTMQQHNYVNNSFNYSPSMYNPTSYPYNNTPIPSVPNTSNNGSPQDYQIFTVPPYQVDNNQYLNSRPSLLPSGSSTADSNGSIVSEFDANHNPIKKRRKPAPTIATGRRNLKDESVNSEEAERRDKRRERNRKSAQRCREKKSERKDALEYEIMHARRTCNKYLGLAENVLKAWKERLHLLNDKFPCNNYKSQLSIAEFENLLEVMQNSNRETQDTGECSSSLIETSTDTITNQEYSLLPPQMSNTFITCNKMEPYYPMFNDVTGVINSGFDQFHVPMSESNSYV